LWINCDVGPDKELVEGLEVLYRDRYRHFLRVASLITGDEGRGHDAVQEAFASALRARRTYRAEGPLEAWVWRAVVNAAKKQRRREPTLALGPEPGALSENGAPDDDRGLRSSIVSLPERQRLAVYLRYYADLDYRSIATVLEVEVGTVSATLSAAHRRLREQIQEVSR
jgi:RNA polymerase sigma-70 factor, ECF subfamily